MGGSSPVCAGVSLPLRLSAFQKIVLPARANPTTATRLALRITAQVQTTSGVPKAASRIKSLPTKPESGGSPAGPYLIVDGDDEIHGGDDRDPAHGRHRYDRQGRTAPLHEVRDEEERCRRERGMHDVVECSGD